MKKKIMTLLLVLLAVSMALFLAGCAPVEDAAVTVAGQTPAQLVQELAASVLQLVLLGVTLLFTRVLLPWVTKTLIPWLETRHLMDIVRIFVASAEKQGETGAILKSRKKDFVIGLLRQKGIHITPEIDEMIEAAVEELDLLGDKLTDAFCAFPGEDDETVGLTD